MEAYLVLCVPKSKEKKGLAVIDIIYSQSISCIALYWQIKA